MIDSDKLLKMIQDGNKEAIGAARKLGANDKRDFLSYASGKLGGMSKVFTLLTGLEEPVVSPIPARFAKPVRVKLTEADAIKHRNLRNEYIASIPKYSIGSASSSKIEGRGIIMCAGGHTHFTNGYIAASMLRHVGCTLPIEFWYLGVCEIDEAMKKLVAPLGVTCIDAELLAETYPMRILNGWELKIYALIHSKFKEILLLDSDNFVVKDPTFLFDIEQFKDTGAIFWPDYNRLGPEREIWKICGLLYNDEPEFESGQIVVDKERCWRELCLTKHLNEYSDFYYRYIHGDKETFHMAWKILGTVYNMPPYVIKGLQATMCQHDFQGNRLFQHRNMDKFKWDETNARVEGFEFEEECFSYLEELKKKWSGKVQLPQPFTVAGKVAAAYISNQLYDYVRGGHDARVIELLPNGKIGLGSADMESGWYVRDRENPELCIVGKRLTCVLTMGKDSIWRGKWLRNERMDVELVAHSIKHARKAKGRKMSSLLLGKRFIYHRVGYDKREIEFADDNKIGYGAGCLEKMWDLEQTDKGLALYIGSSLIDATCELYQDGDLWKGRWLKHEKMPVELIPLSKVITSPIADPSYSDSQLGNVCKVKTQPSDKKSFPVHMDKATMDMLGISAIKINVLQDNLSIIIIHKDGVRPSVTGFSIIYQSEAK
jgi:hypothetical protein